MARYREAGIAVTYEGTFGGMRFAHLDTRPQIGCVTELVERHPVSEGLFSMVAEAAAGWDGTNPIRQIPV